MMPSKSIDPGYQTSLNSKARVIHSHKFFTVQIQSLIHIIILCTHVDRTLIAAREAECTRNASEMQS